MKYKRLGRCGLKVGEISLGAGNWGIGAMDDKAVRELMALAMDHGVIYFDNAESYGDGASEECMGRVLKTLNWPRVHYIVSTKFFWGISKGPNEKNTLNRKYLLQGIDKALQRTQLDYIDIAYCHRPDPHTPIEETVWAFHTMIEAGKVLYWGTSEWSADELRAAWDIAERHHLHKPVVEQPEYNLLKRRKVDREYRRVCEDAGIGLAVWSALAGGTLTGKYLDGIPADSRAAAMAGMPHLGRSLTEGRRIAIVAKLKAIADDIGCSLAHMSLAWCALHPDVSTLILGVSRPSQLLDNLKALEAVPRLTAEVRARIDEAVGDYSESWVGNSPWHYE